MKISLHSEYALLSLLHLARPSNSLVRSESIQASLQMPSELMNEIVVTLVDEKYVRFQNGNLRLARPAERIQVIDIIRLFDGALAPLEPVSTKGYQSAPMEREEKLAELFSQLQEQIIARLEKTTLADLL